MTPFPGKVAGCMSVRVYVQQDLVNCWVEVYKLIKAISLNAKGEAIRAGSLNYFSGDLKMPRCDWLKFCAPRSKSPLK